MTAYSSSASTPKPVPDGAAARPDAARAPLARGAPELLGARGAPELLGARGARAAVTPLWHFFRSIFHNAPEAIAMLDASLGVVVWNAAATALSGHAAPEVLGRRCRVDGTAILLDLAADPAEDGPRALRSRPSASGRFSIHEVDGSRATFPATVIPLQYDGSMLLMLPRPPARPARRRAPARLGARPTAPARRLTEREHEILKLLAGGKTAKAIAADLSLSLPTVRSHTQHILRKLGVHSALEAVVWFLRSADGTARG